MGELDDDDDDGGGDAATADANGRRRNMYCTCAERFGYMCSFYVPWVEGLFQANLPLFPNLPFSRLAF